jgi:hypothetical protein
MQEEGSGGEEEDVVSLNMPARVIRMPKAALATDIEAEEDVLKEGEYETSFGRVVVEETGQGYKITIYISGKKLGQQLARQIAHSFIGTANLNAV